MIAGPTSILTSDGIFQKYCPPNSQTIPSGMNCLYCCQFCIVITVPGAIVSVAAASGLPFWPLGEAGTAAAAGVAPLAFMGTLFPWARTVVEPIRIASQNVRQANIFESVRPILAPHLESFERGFAF